MNALADILHQPVAQRLGWALLHFLWQGATIGLIFAGGMRLLRNRSANARYTLGCGSLCSMVAAVALTFGLQSKGGDGSSPGNDKQSHSPARTASIPTAMESGTTPDTVTTAHRVDGSASPSAVQTLRPILPLIVATWLAGVCLLSIRLAFGWVNVQVLRFRGTEPTEIAWTAALARLRRQLRVSRPVRMLKSCLVEVPTVIGWVRPLILMPASTLSGLTPAQIEMILAHELAHIRRYDYLVNLLQSLVETLLFYHPVVWWVSGASAKSASTAATT